MRDRKERREDELSAAEFRQLFEAVSTWGRWGAEDERGALNYLTPPGFSRPRGSFGAARP